VTGGQESLSAPSAGELYNYESIVFASLAPPSPCPLPLRGEREMPGISMRYTLGYPAPPPSESPFPPVANWRGGEGWGEGGQIFKFYGCAAGS